MLSPRPPARRSPAHEQRERMERPTQPRRRGQVDACTKRAPWSPSSSPNSVDANIIRDGDPIAVGRSPVAPVSATIVRWRPFGADHYPPLSPLYHPCTANPIPILHPCRAQVLHGHHCTSDVHQVAVGPRRRYCALLGHAAPCCARTLPNTPSPPKFVTLCPHT